MEIGFFLLAIVATGVLIGSAIDRHNRQLRQIEGKLDAVMAHLQIEYDPNDILPEDFVKEMELGNRIKAIKIYRQHFGASLDEAKTFVEGYQAS